MMPKVSRVLMVLGLGATGVTTLGGAGCVVREPAEPAPLYH
jgi:hypothetical protein